MAHLREIRGIVDYSAKPDIWSPTPDKRERGIPEKYDYRSGAGIDKDVVGGRKGVHRDHLQYASEGRANLRLVGRGHGLTDDDTDCIVESYSRHNNSTTNASERLIAKLQRCGRDPL